MAALTSDEIRACENDSYVIPALRVPEERMAVLSAAMKVASCPAKVVFPLPLGGL